MHVAVWMAVGEVVVEESEKLQHLLRELLVGVLVSTQCRGGGGVGAGSPSQPEVDPPGGECLQHAELLGDQQGRGAVPEGLLEVMRLLVFLA